ncbi:hypothetical protein CJ739_3480 [Mariniflexile rhizosphaerae]|uniref:HNH endonuclease n=1 Tax=unclassified Mariniflexile TaxID=2643887 RepID=UPI000CBADF39|nr:HNH endonuclease [Mariniflexile sp. TRM1-10]AXP82542.1 hypothetical protein CJ739_3480 [Mariniflexile sp. TRM1-10]PLB19545.1 MAG: hypothetical protein TRG1_1594 [Flavobacteriaceae bacterium FS1-H7996/R]
MHFFNRNLFVGSPTKELEELNKKEQPKWLLYKSYIKENQEYRDNPKTIIKPDQVKMPSNYWNSDSIRLPLITFFESNCGYCGIYCDKNNDGEVDHHFPKELDEKAEKIYLWDNYVWSCHSCNNKKRNHSPLLDPCQKHEMGCIIFSPTTGNYDINLEASVSADIIEKYELTVIYTFINGKKRPNSRRLIYKQMLNQHMQMLKTYYKLLPLLVENTPEFDLIQKSLLNEENEFREFINEGNYLALKRYIFNLYKSSYSIPYNFEYFT